MASHAANRNLADRGGNHWPNGAARSKVRSAMPPLSSGLDIVRKTLGQHGIATVQSTAIDETAGIANLTTVLAHSTGESIAPDYPVWAISETRTPQRMRAALTYARRYALFTLAGIAGENDFNVPDPMAPMPPASAAAKPAPVKHGRPNGGSNKFRAVAVQHCDFCRCVVILDLSVQLVTDRT